MKYYSIYKKNISSNRFSSSKKEYIDSDSKKKPVEEDVKISEISEFRLEPRDARKNYFLKR